MSTKKLEVESGEASLGDLILTLLLRDANITDVHCATDEPLRARRASNDWIVPRGPGDRPYIVSRNQITALINGIYEGEEVPYLFETDGSGHTVQDENKRPMHRVPRWVGMLKERKVLHPSKTLNDLVTVDGHEQPVSLRVRFTIERQSMGDAIGVMARGLRPVPETTRDLGLPVQLEHLVKASTAGLLIVTGPTGSGKSTTIAAILQGINRERTSNIVTLEDPVEFEYTADKSFFNQREIGVDVASFEEGVQDAMRFAPDIIVIGEIRTAETMRAALRAAESGHLVLASTHAPSCVATIRKMLAYLDSPSDAIALANALIGVLAQALIPDADPKTNRKHLAFELLPGSVKEAQDAIASMEGVQLSKLEEALRGGKFQQTGALPFITSLRKLVAEQKISPARAAAIAQAPEDRQELLGHGRGAAPSPSAPPVRSGEWASRTLATAVGTAAGRR